MEDAPAKYADLVVLSRGTKIGKQQGEAYEKEPLVRISFSQQAVRRCSRFAAIRYDLSSVAASRMRS